MGFTIEVGRDPDIVNDINSFGTGQDASHYLYIISKTLPAAIGVSLTDMEALVKMEVTNTRYKFATFSISGASWSIDNIESSWHNAGSTVKQLISVSSGTLGISTGNYVGIVFEVPANTSQTTFIYYEDGGSSLTNYYQISGSYITSGTATSASQPPLDIYGYGEYTHSNTDPIPQNSQSTGALSVGELYTGYGAIRLTDLDCVGTYSALLEMQAPWGATDNTVVLENGESETLSRAITGGTEYYKVTVTNINCVSNTVTFTEQWWSDLGNRYVKTTGSDSALGTTWDVAWLTMGYGFQNIPSGKDLYVEEGLYGGETLSNLDPTQTMSMYIQPDTHDENPCRVFISDGSIINVGTCVIGTSQGSHSDLYTAINRTAISSDCTLATFCMHVNDAGGANADIKLKIFRSDGTNYNVVHTSDEWINISGAHTFEVIWPVLSGDYIGFALRYVLYSSVKLETTGGSYHHVAGDINTSIPISSCSASTWLYTFGATGLS